MKDLIRAERERTVPGYLTAFHYIGAMTLLFLVLQVVTGILLMVYYRPTATAAHDSVAIITDEVRFGWFIRSLHRWGSDLVIALVGLHVARTYFARAYREPRQLTWMLGVILFLAVIALGFTGTLLPWDQYAYWYVDSARKTFAAVPVLGGAALGFFWGSWELGEEVLLRFYVLHVGALPWLTGLVLFFHLAMVWRLGIREPSPGRGALERMRFFPDFALNLLIAALLAAAVLITLAVVEPPVLLEEADPLSPLAHPIPPWYLLPIRGLLREPTGVTAALSAVAVVTLLLLVPVLDSGRADAPWKTALQRGLGVAVIAGIVLLGAKAYLE